MGVILLIEKYKSTNGEKSSPLSLAHNAMSGRVIKFRPSPDIQVR
ncbi:hypothetical protein AC062_2434 [Pasteurellaceae bacterium NI1060]|nr:hypothetical protein AC062_2434 [Pasteurellaceae bacterium NI1060]